ncbi:MAG: hypothetical protein IPP40_15035 [bacterium]|nr:hypothetical protein [bacterium]
MKKLFACFVFLGVCLVATAATDNDAEHRERNPLDQGADWCPATVIASAPFIDFGTTTGQNNDWNPTCAQCCQAEDVIYEFTPTVTSIYRVSLCLSNSFDSILEIRTDGACPGSTQIACSDDVCGAQAQADVEMLAGTTYYIIIDGYFESDGPYIFQLLQFGYGAESCPATVITSLPYTDTGTTIGRTNDFSFCSGGTSPDVIFEYTASATANYTFSLCGSSYFTRLFLNTGGSCPGNTQVFCGDVGCPISGRTQFTTLLYESLTYYIIVDGNQGDLGNYVFNLTREMSCDTCEADNCPATLIPSIPYVDSGTTTGKANNFSSVFCGGQNAPDVIYALSVPTTQYVVAWLTDETLPFEHSLALRSGSTCPGTNIECNIDGNNGDGASITFQAAAFQTYYLVIDNSSTHEGDYVLHVDNLCSVIQQPGDLVECAETPSPGTVHQVVDCDGGCNNVIYGGVATFINLNLGQTVFGKMFTYTAFQRRPDTDWYQFTLAQSCSLSLTVSAEFPWQGFLFPAGCGNTYYHLYDGPACSTTTFIEHGSPFHVLPAGTYNLHFQAQQDTMIPTMLDYRLRIDNYVVCNEDGAITTLPGSFSSNTCGEGDDCTLDIQQQQETEDRLIRVDIPETGNYTFSLCSSVEPWNSMLSILSTCCGMNNLIAQDDDGCGEQEGLSQINCLSLDAGSYFALVENNGNAGGSSCTNDFTLTVTPCECPKVDSLTIEPFEDFSVFLSFYVPEPGLVKFYYSTNAAQEYPTGFTLVDQYQANSAGRVNFYEINAPDPFGRFVVTLNNCGL